MEVNGKVVAAIGAALHLYMQAEQQAALPPAEGMRAPEIPRPTYSPWVMGGRQTAMETRRFWQMRLVR